MAKIRVARTGDAPEIARIYNISVLHGAATFQITPDTVGERNAWLKSHGPRHPVFVLELGAAIAGWGALSPYCLREAWRYTVEDSIYIDAKYQARGLGTLMLSHLLETARNLGHRVVLARIVASHEASIVLHKKLGFFEAGRLTGVGHKFGCWHDVLYLEKDFFPVSQ